MELKHARENATKSAATVERMQAELANHSNRSDDEAAAVRERDSLRIENKRLKTQVDSLGVDSRAARKSEVDARAALIKMQGELDGEKKRHQKQVTKYESVKAERGTFAIGNFLRFVIRFNI